MSHLPKDLYLPAIWFEAHMQLPEFESEMMYQVVHIPSTMTLTAIVGIALNSIIFMLSLYCLTIRRQRDTGTQMDPAMMGVTLDTEDVPPGMVTIKLRSELPTLNESSLIRLMLMTSSTARANKGLF